MLFLIRKLINIFCGDYGRLRLRLPSGRSRCDYPSHDIRHDTKSVERQIFVPETNNNLDSTRIRWLSIPSFILRAYEMSHGRTNAKIYNGTSHLKRCVRVHSDPSGVCDRYFDCSCISLVTEFSFTKTQSSLSMMHIPFRKSAPTLAQVRAACLKRGCPSM